MNVSGIAIKKEDFVARLRLRYASKLDSLPTPDAQCMTLAEANSYMNSHALLLNKIELENLFDHFAVPGEDPPKADMDAFFLALRDNSAGVDPVNHELYPPDSENTAHLNLSGVSHMTFGETYKPTPKHWGVPPNAQMKGHDGVVRDLPGGYGKGNAPMFNWVNENMTKDRATATDERGNKPYPYGNYSL